MCVIVLEQGTLNVLKLVETYLQNKGLLFEGYHCGKSFSTPHHTNSNF